MGCAKVHILLHLLHLRILVCAAFFAFHSWFSLIKFSLRKFLCCQGWLVGCGGAFLLAGVHFLADIDQVYLLGGGGELLG